MIGTILSNRYKLIAELGSGGVAWVYLAEDLIEKHKVAVKVLYPQHSKDLRFLQHFVREAESSMTLSQSSPQENIVRILDYGADRDTHYLVMEYVQGQDLGQMVDQEGPLPWQRALDIARQVASALEHAYRSDIVHRDIKPSNIMISPDGTVRVLDFGIAWPRTSRGTKLSGFVGSPHYAAPEQATGQPVDIRADLYSLGVVLYRMLSGDLPFQGDTPWAVVNQHIMSDPPPLHESRPDLPQPVIHLVQKAMAKRPQDRFQTPTEMVQAINAVDAGVDFTSEPAPAFRDLAALSLDTLYLRAQQATEAERWQEAVDLYSQILKLDPEYRDVTDQLEEVGQQIRLANLYRSARRALEAGQWDTALAQLDRIAAIAPAYKDIKDLRIKAEQREKLPVARVTSSSEFPTQIPGKRADDVATSAARAAVPIKHPPEAAPAVTAASRVRRWRWLGVLLLALVVAAAVFLVLISQPRLSPTPIVGAQPSPTLIAQFASTPMPTLFSPSPISTIYVPDPTQTLPSGGVSAIASPTSTSTPRPSSTPTPTPSSTATLTPTATLNIAPAAAARPSLAGQIVFPRFDPDRATYDLYVCQVDGADCRQVAAEASQPDFLPDGNRLVAHSWKADAKGLIVIRLSGQLIWRITDQIEAARPSVNPQGDTYVYESRQESDRQPRLFRTYGTENQPITRDGSAIVGQSPFWLPDQRILYSGCWQNDCGILVMREDGTHPRQVVAGSTETNAEASPDGRQVALMSLRDGNWEVYVADLDGSHLRRLTRGTANDGLPTWSPDGQYIAFVTDRDGPWAVWVMRPDGSQQRRLFDIGGPLYGRVRSAAAHETGGWIQERISWAP